ncbi:MAG: sigma-54 dependent transcriptional regulator [Verrucomicrobiales bacterium]|nr:sigma-54 dependent transcriptional regulator [Verrucomicrobiales bacterium]
MAKILIVDDETAILNLMAKACQQSGHETVAVNSEEGARKALETQDFDVLVVDLVLGDGNGMDVVRFSEEKCPDAKVIMVTGHGTIETAVEAMRLGAFDYLTKPFELADLKRAVDLAYQQKMSPESKSSDEAKAFELAWSSGELIGKSDKMKAINELAAKIAENDSPILIEGEFGTGKQMVARTIHNSSSRKDAPFKVLQCSALPEDLLEAELFGSIGSRGETIFSRAMGGTVLLEEIHMLPVRLQSMLEAYLEEVSERRMSGSLPMKMDVRFIASSAKKLEECVAEGKFREDLFYKISVIPVDVPPLRNRKVDIGLLAEYFLKRYTDRTGSKPMEVDKYASRLLENYTWPGNVGELQNAIERACAFSEDGRIRPIDLPPKVAQKVEITDEDEKTTHHLPIGTALSEYIKKQEKLFIRETLKYNEGSREKTASMLDVSIATLYRKMGLKLERDKILNS